MLGIEATLLLYFVCDVFLGRIVWPVFSRSTALSRCGNNAPPSIPNNLGLTVVGNCPKNGSLDAYHVTDEISFTESKASQS